jgi:signal transduction histidine kinase
MLLSKTRVVFIQGVTIISLMTFLVVGIYEVPFTEYDAHLGTTAIVMILMLVASYMLESYIRQLDFHAAESDRKASELEVYTQLLRHDLRNDLQAILNSVELAEMFLELNPQTVKENLTQSLSLGLRMVQLLNVFSMPLEQPGTNLVSHIKEVAEESQEAFGNLRIEVSSTNDVHSRTFTASRLLPMVWTNIFRNAAQYGNDPSIVKAAISIDEDTFLVSVCDNGPGIPDDKKDWLFKRGSGSGTTGGQGLYLSKIVLESHHGSIELLDVKDQSGSEFIIRIPANPI